MCLNSFAISFRSAKEELMGVALSGGDYGVASLFSPPPITDFKGEM